MRKAIIRTLAYADIFDYPLTAKEIHRWLLKGQTLKETQVKRSNLIRKSGRYYYLSGRSNLASLRRQRNKWSNAKLKIAVRVGQWLKTFPWIKLVAVTGALAMNNADQDDDIDLMIVTCPNRLWLTRLLVVPLISAISNRRTPSKKSANSICLNLWLDQTALTISTLNRNLYIAHEVAQIKPLWDRENTYQKFLSVNSWINHYLPNVPVPGPPGVARRGVYSPRGWPNRLSLGGLVGFLDFLAFHLQYWYMKPKITREKICRNSAFFHPGNRKKYIMQQYRQRLKKFKI